MKYASNFGKPLRIANENTPLTSFVDARYRVSTILENQFLAKFPPAVSKPLVQIDCEWDG
jgi:hypothetical protein